MIASLVLANPGFAAPGMADLNLAKFDIVPLWTSNQLPIAEAAYRIQRQHSTLVHLSPATNSPL